MNFVMVVPRTKTDKNALWVIVDTLTKTARCVAMKINWSM